MRVSLPSLAKLNLDLRVLSKRADGFHELRTVFQTISLRDKLVIDWKPARRSSVTIDSSVDITDNLAVRAMRLALEHVRVTARVRIALVKQIPMGAGMGGGSSNAASALIAAAALSGRRVPLAELVALGESLGSDVPFFFYGGTAVGLGRGSELYPLPDATPHPMVVVATGVHVSTAEAYQGLGRSPADSLTSERERPILREFQSLAWSLSQPDWDRLPLRNDFEEAVFAAHPAVAKAVRKLRRSGARSARMTGSGSAVFGTFSDLPAAEQAVNRFPAGAAQVVRFVNRAQYVTMWRKALGASAAGSYFAEPQF